MSKSEEAIDKLNLKELKVATACFSHPKALEVLRIYHRLAGYHQKNILIKLRSRLKEKEAKDVE